MLHIEGRTVRNFIILCFILGCLIGYALAKAVLG